MHYHKRLHCHLLAIVLLFSFSALIHADHNDHSGHGNHTHSLQIHHARINPTVPGMSVTGAYFDLFNSGKEDIRLIGASSKISNHIEVHEHINKDGLMKMQEVPEGVVVSAGQKQSFKPGGYHLMIMNLKTAVKEGSHIELILHFSNGTSKSVTAKAIKPSHNTHKHHHHKH